MGKKYIIELLDDCNSEFKGIMAFGLTQEKQISVELIPEESLRPYTEPDIEQIRKEAYEDGYKTAKVQCNIQAEKDLREVGERHYQKGLSDAWEAARKIASDNSGRNYSIFGQHFTVEILNTHSASEAIEKINQYEQEQDGEIKVGDEVINQNKTAVVTEITDRYTRIMYSDGSGYALFAKGLTKTGRHFPEIAEVLQKMKEA